MHKRLPPLDLLRGFEAAARHLSFTRAAGELFLTQSAVSRQMQALEEAIGTPLFRREHRRLVLTDAGQELQLTANRVLRDFADTIERLGGGGPRPLTVTTMVTFASLWLVPRLPRFRQEHPGTDVHISANNDLVDLDRSRMDVAIRYVAPAAAPAGATPLFGEEVLPVCSPALLGGRAGRMKKPADLQRHVLLHMDDAHIHNPYLEWRVWLEAMGLPDLKAQGALYFSHYDQMIQAAVEGQGVALGRIPLLSDHLRRGQLVAPFAGRNLAGPASTRGYFVILSGAARARADAQAFCRWLQDEGRRDQSPPMSLLAR